MEILLLVLIAFGVSIAMTLAWAIQRWSGASGWIDTIWSLAVGAGSIAAALAAEGDMGRRMVVVALVAIWSLRLASHIGSRTRGGGEDPRYAKLVEEWGQDAPRKLFLFLQAQAFAAWVLIFAVHLAATGQDVFPQPTDVIAIVLAIIALIGEGVSDWQLASYRKTAEAKHRVCEIGFWRYSRHPNYFFEWVFWCAITVMAIDFQNAVSFLAVLAPLQMYWLLVHVSGIPPLEEHMLRSRGDAFRDVQARVNAFFPGPRRMSAQKGDRP